MKHIKKMLAAVLACAMVMAMGIGAFAASITLTDEPDKFKDDHTYNVYQIFTGDVATKTVTEGETTKTVKELQNVKYGSSYGDTGASVPKSVLDQIEDARAFADSLVKADPAVLGDPVAQLKKDNGFKAEGLATGYYLIVDTATGELKEGDVYSQYIVQILEDVSIATKKDVPESKKEITSDDHPSSEGGEANPGISGDKKTDNVSIGDTVTFTVTAKVPAHATDYDYYYFIIGDKLSAGLTFGEIKSVQVDGTDMKKKGANGVEDKDAEYALYTGADTSNNNTFEVALLKANTAAFAGKTITVVYTATLNENAVIGGEGNDNTVKVTYSNDPNNKYNGTNDETKPGKPDSTKEVPTGETPEEVTKTFTSGIKLQKIDQDGNALKGASFTIEGDSINKVVKNVETFEEASDGTYYKLKTGAYTTEAPQTEDTMVAAPAGATDGYVVAAADFDGETITVGGTKYRVVNKDETPTHILKKKNVELYEDVAKKYKKTTTEQVVETTNHISQELPVNDDGTLNFEGLGAGTYTIKETTVPDGYSKASDTTVVITFNNTTKKFTATVNGTEVSEDATTNLFPVDVKNIAGNALPSTGGIGTTIFYVVGTILVLGAGVLLVTKRRMRAE